VQDNGIGFDDKYAEDIFRVFKRLHNYQDYEGTGVGLSICKKIVERHNGFIRAESQIDRGSTFIIGLPEAHFPN
jgi:light-regulated signal transduction histidine kinase (bacteriophytochrome)